MSAIRQIQDSITDMSRQIDELQRGVMALPEWMPITKSIAEQYGYSGTNGLRDWIVNNLPPRLRRKHDGKWEFHRSAGYLIQNRIK